MQPAVFFDLDGTLTDSGPGILNCAELALRHFGLPVPDRQTLRAFVGPPLRETFPRFGVPEARVEEAIAVFRGRYLTVGKFENAPYPGIRELLEALTAAGVALYVATSKPEDTALEIMQKFDLARYFRRICGATSDTVRETKEAVMAYLLACLPEGQRAVMVGDTVYDVNGAAAHGVPPIGVSWGYGSVAEMRAAGAGTIVDTPEQLETLLLSEISTFPNSTGSLFFH